MGGNSTASFLTFTMDDDLHTRFKVACVQEKLDMAEVLRECVERFVEKVEKKQK